MQCHTQNIEPDGTESVINSSHKIAIKVPDIVNEK